MNMNNAWEEDINNIYRKCRESKILHLCEVLNSHYNNEYCECLQKFIYVTLFNRYNSPDKDALGNDAVDISHEICHKIIYPKGKYPEANISFDKSFSLDGTELYSFLTKVIRRRLIDLLRKDKSKKNDEQISYDENNIIEDPHCMVDEIENFQMNTEFISKILNITDLYHAIMFLLIRYFKSFKPIKLAAILQKNSITTDDEFAELAVKILEHQGYYLSRATIKEIGYKGTNISSKSLSDAASHTARILHAKIHNFGIDKSLIEMYEKAKQKSK